MAEAVASEKLGGVGSKRRWQTPAAGAVGSCIEEEAPLDVGWRPVVSRAAGRPHRQGLRGDDSRKSNPLRGGVGTKVVFGGSAIKR